MNANLFKVERREITVKGLLKAYTKVRFVVVYKGADLDSYMTEQEAADVIEDVCATVLDGGEWAFEEGLRNIDPEIRFAA